MNKSLKLIFIYLSALLILHMYSQSVVQSGFFDIESGQPAAMAMSSLDLAADGGEDFKPELSSVATSSRLIKLFNTGGADFNIDIDANSFTPLEACNAIIAAVYYDGSPVFIGNLVDFAVFNVMLNSGENRELLIEASLAAHTASTVCEFNLDFSAHNNTGFNDEEKLQNTINIVDQSAQSILITKVYNSPDKCHGFELRNEWWELYNPTNASTSLKKWIFCNKDRCRQVKQNYILKPGEYIRISQGIFTKWFYASTTKFISIGGWSINMDRRDDMAALFDPNRKLIDQVNWGNAAGNWKNYNSSLWPIGVKHVERGHVIGRIDDNIDTNTPSDFTDLGMPDCLFECSKKDKKFKRFKDELDFCNLEFDKWLDGIWKKKNNNQKVQDNKESEEEKKEMACEKQEGCKEKEENEPKDDIGNKEEGEGGGEKKKENDMDKKEYMEENNDKDSDEEKQEGDEG